jgi:hypothetical protein
MGRHGLLILKRSARHATGRRSASVGNIFPILAFLVPVFFVIQRMVHPCLVTIIVFIISAILFFLIPDCWWVVIHVGCTEGYAAATDIGWVCRMGRMVLLSESFPLSSTKGDRI